MSTCPLSLTVPDAGNKGANKADVVLALMELMMQGTCRGRRNERTAVTTVSTSIPLISNLKLNDTLIDLEDDNFSKSVYVIMVIF